MTDLQRADSAASRKAIIIVIISVIVGSLLIVVFETFRTQLNEWPLSDHARRANRSLQRSLAGTFVKLSNGWRED